MCEEIDDYRLEQAGGQDLIFQIMEDRFPGKPAPEKVAEGMSRCLRMRVEKD